MESEAEADAVREVYERAIANVPPAEEKRLWRRYIYLWINYALYEELIAKVNIRPQAASLSFFLVRRAERARHETRVTEGARWERVEIHETKFFSSRTATLFSFVSTPLTKTKEKQTAHSPTWAEILCLTVCYGPFQTSNFACAESNINLREK